VKRFYRFLNHFPWNLAGLFLVVRLMLVMASPIDAMRGYGDYVHFYRLAELGRPFLDYWVEFPPVFPFLINLLYHLSSGQEHTFDYLLIVVLSLAQAGNLVIFGKIATELMAESTASRLTWFYLVLLSSLSYGWWYFDSLAVFAMLLALHWLMSKMDYRAGLAIAAGMLTKWFPALVLAIAWRFRPTRRAIATSAIALTITLAVFLGLYLLAPEMTLASLSSQSAKGSWETVWALLDGNFSTGNLGPEWQRIDPNSLAKVSGDPPFIPQLLTLAFFAAIGLWCFGRVRKKDNQTIVAFLGLTWCIFLLWSPGWSPQWILYLLPLILLGLPFRSGVVFSLNLLLVSLLEWPILLTRGRFDLLWIPVLLRTLLLIFLALVASRVAFRLPDRISVGGTS
jgi:hypothetical protein